MGTFALYCGCLDDGDLLIVATAHDPTQLLLTMLSVGQLRLCSDVLNFVAFVWSLLIFRTRNAFLNYLLYARLLCVSVFLVVYGNLSPISSNLKIIVVSPRAFFILALISCATSSLTFISILIPSLTLPTLVSNPILASNKWDTLSSLLIH